MLGPSGAGRPWRRIFSRNLGQLAAALGIGFAFVGGAIDCGFPQYGFGAGGAGGSSAGAGGSWAGAGGVSGGAGGVSGASGTPMGGNAGTFGGSAGHSGTSGEAGEAGAAGAGAPCVYPTPVTYPVHCFNASTDGGETGLNCGGECAPCTRSQACLLNSDCASNVCTSAKTCSQVLSMTYMSIVGDASTPTPKFNLSIRYLDRVSTLLRDLRIRYYFNHSGVAEPLLAHTQATYDPGLSQRNLRSDELSYRIVRYPPGPADSNGIVTDSYLEITFPSSASLTTNSTLNLTQDIVVPASASSGAEFQQALNYSFLNRALFAVNDYITVYRGDQLVWGVPPPMNPLPDCAFAAGVNLDGPAVIADGQALQSSSDANIAYSGATYQNSATFVPAVDPGTAALLHAGFALGSASASWQVPSGKYWAYVWLTSDPSLASGQLSIQDIPRDRFIGSAEGGATAWARIGPYTIDALDGSVKLSASGTVDVAGIELYRPAPAP